MARIKFRDIRMSRQNRERLELVNEILEEYQADGYVLTLRQLYYQLVSRGVVENSQKEYGKLSILLKEGRMGGVVDWDAIEDRLRVPSSPASFESPEDVLDAAVNQYQLPRQEGQPVYMEVWVEKDALSGVLSRVTWKYHVPIMVNRGYSSASAMYDAFMRFVTRGARKDRPARVIYLGDFDPSGLDMIRDIKGRIKEFEEGYLDHGELDFDVDPVALTRGQITQYDPPPNPAKVTDPRAKWFIQEHGTTSWEVDALRPETLNGVLEDGIQEYLDMEVYDEVVSREEADRKRLRELKIYLKH